MDVSGTIGAVLNQKSREIYSVSPGATVFEAVQLMDTKNVGALLVLDGQRLVGVISERDYTRKIMLRGKRSRETKVAEIMSTNVFTTHRREGVETCLRLMTDQHIRHLPVVDDDKVVGVISISSCSPPSIWRPITSPSVRAVIGPSSLTKARFVWKMRATL